MGIYTEAVTGKGISFIVDDEVKDLIKVVDFFTKNDEEKTGDREKFYKTKDEEENIIEMLEVYLDKSLTMEVFGNSVTGYQMGVMISGNDELINKLITDLKLDKTISDMAEVYIG